ncbi:MAG: hypothetical protein UT61_C0012G0027 [Candidatus Woesebacteria bacterium GW2011_GWA1_39_8]|uniref:Uncharacterized protein n=1 Tax=Candidatus Woesebacteria bacterium GW2011_GWA1_39_8 TaxID=1618552 RepID=A0A0G0SX54_9BACT|nr:MAG: hypothetical protein UT61_C0012G0027 [Candidatus Woesebacteria bacterium GW2011_GWA1_39_8]
MLDEYDFPHPERLEVRLMENRDNLTLTLQELRAQQAQLERTKGMARDGFFTTRPTENAIQEGHVQDEHGVVYQGGGNG